MKSKKLFRRSMILTVLIIAIMVCTSIVANAEDDSIIASGTDGGITWQIDESGCLTVTGEGEEITLEAYDENSSVAPWQSNADNIKSAKVSVKGLKSMSCFFSEWLVS